MFCFGGARRGGVGGPVVEVVSSVGVAGARFGGGGLSFAFFWSGFRAGSRWRRVFLVGLSAGPLLLACAGVCFFAGVWSGRRSVVSCLCPRALLAVSCPSFVLVASVGLLLQGFPLSPGGFS